MHNFILTNIIFFTTIIVELIFNSIQATNSHLSIEKFFGLFLILYIFSFIKNNIWRRISMNFIVFLSFFQMIHLQFYGMPIYPNAIYLLFADLGEVTGTLFQEIHFFFIPALLMLPALFINIFCDKKAYHLKRIPFLHFLFIFYFCYNPIRTYVTGNTWGRQPSSQEFMGMNVYLSTSYFLGRLLPSKLLNRNFVSVENKIKLTKTKAQNINILFVLGESLTPNHMGLFAQEKQTTPYLVSIKDDPNFFYLRGISSGVSTDIAVAMLMNNTYGLGGNKDISLGSKCLFKLARDQDFTTHFYSTQSAQQLRYITNSICPKHIENYKDLDVIDPHLENSNQADDKKLISLLPDDLSKKQFYILHQRGSHSPYELRYQKVKFKLTEDATKNRAIHYHNSVYEFDHFMKTLITKVKSYSTPTIVIYASDHGEGLGEEGVWGHAALKRPSLEIPILFYLHKADFLKEKIKLMPENPTQLNLSLFISQLLGYKANQSIYQVPSDYTILANDIDGFAGFLETEFDSGKLISIERKDI